MGHASWRGGTHPACAYRRLPARHHRLHGVSRHLRSNDCAPWLARRCRQPSRTLRATEGACVSCASASTGSVASTNGFWLCQTPRFNLLGDTHDLRHAVKHIADKVESLRPGSPLFLVGISAGSGLLVRYLGEEGPRSLFTAAASLCPGYDLRHAFARVQPFCTLVCCVAHVVWVQLRGADCCMCLGR